MNATRRPLGNACISIGNGYAFDASAAGAAEAATSAAKSESSMRFPPRAAHGSRHPPRIKESNASDQRQSAVSAQRRKRSLKGSVFGPQTSARSARSAVEMKN